MTGSGNRPVRASCRKRSRAGGREARGAEKRAELIAKQAGLQTRADELEEEAFELLEPCEGQVLGNDLAAAHGFMWLYLRK